MSKPGDVVWADGKSWQKDVIVPPSPGRPSWYSPLPPDTFDLRRRLKHLKAFKDFRWLVKDGEVVRNYDDAVKEYEQIIATLQKQARQWKENFDHERGAHLRGDDE